MPRRESGTIPEYINALLMSRLSMSVNKTIPPIAPPHGIPADLASECMQIAEVLSNAYRTPSNYISLNVDIFEIHFCQ